jgi:hypothetical protein
MLFSPLIIGAQSDGFLFSLGTIFLDSFNDNRSLFAFEYDREDESFQLDLFWFHII